MSESFKDLLEQYDIMNPNKVEQKGVVVDIAKSFILLDSGFKSEVIVPKEEFEDFSEIKKGEVVDYIVKEWDNGFGQTFGSRKEIIENKKWNFFEEAKEENKTVIGKGIKESNGGLVVSINNFNCFLPRSLVDVKPNTNVHDLVGQDIKAKVIKINKNAENVLISRKAYLQEELNIEVPNQEIEVGNVVKGLVKNIVNYGAFIDLGRKDALLHISDISWVKINSPSEVLEEGDTIECLVLDIKDDGKITLGYKQLKENPWEALNPGEEMEVIVTKKADFGLMCKNENNLEGVIPSEADVDFSDVNIGETLNVIIDKVDVDERKMILKWTPIQE